MSASSALAEPAADPHALLSQRNRDGELTAPGQWNQVLETILSHRSVRGFLPRRLPDNTLELLIAAAQSASTSSNLQFWSVVAVQEPERRSRLAELAGQQQFIRDAPLLLVWLADLSRLTASPPNAARASKARTIWRSSSSAWSMPRWLHRAH